MALLSVTEIGGVAVNAATNYVVKIPYGDSGAVALSAALRQRANRFPELDSLSFAAKAVPFTVSQRPGAGVAADQFDEDVHKLFAPLGGELTLQATAKGVTLQNSAVVTDFRRVAGSHLYAGTLLFKSPVWRSTTTQTDAASPLTAGGNVRALPVLTLTGYDATITSSSVANPTAITTAAAHGLATGDRVKIAGHSGSTPSLNGEHVVTVTSATAFTIPVNVTVGGTGGTVTRVIFRWRVTVTDTGGRGLANYPIMAQFDSRNVGATTSARFACFSLGRLIPHYVNTPNDPNTKIWFRLDCPPSGSATVDIYGGGVIDNTVTNDTLEWAGLKLSSTTISNTNWEWDDFRCSIFPAVTGAWKPVKAGQNVDGVSFGITVEGAGAVTNLKTGAITPTNTITLAVKPDSTLRNDADALLLVVGAGAGTTNALTNLYRNMVVTAGSVRGRVQYRVAGSSVWQTVADMTTTTSSTAALDLDNAVEIMLVLEPLNASANATWEIGITGGTAAALALTGAPTVSVAAAVTARRVNGVLTNTTNGKTLTFADLYQDDVALTINCLTRALSVASGPWYGKVSPSDKDNWLTLGVGANAWTDFAGVQSSWAWEDSYLL